MMLYKFIIIIASVTLFSCTNASNTLKYGNLSSVKNNKDVLHLQNTFSIDKKIVKIKYSQNIRYCYLIPTARYDWMISIDAEKFKTSKDNGIVLNQSFASITEVEQRNNLLNNTISVKDFMPLKNNSGSIEIDVSKYFKDIKFQRSQGNLDNNGGILLEMMRCSDIEKSLKDRNRDDILHFQYGVRFRVRTH